MLESLTPNKSARLAELDVAAAAAAAANSNVLVVPELFLTGYNLEAPFVAEPIDGPSIAIAASIAVKYAINIVFTWPESDAATGKLYDAAALIGRNGSTLAHYRKVNLAVGENAFFTPGDVFAPVVDVDGVRVGLLICFDVFLPEPARTLALDSVQVILIPTANGYPLGINVLSTLVVPTRALENNAAVAYVNWVQANASFPEFLTFHGQTTVAGFGGSLLYIGPANTSALQHVPLNMSNYTPGSTAFGRPAPDFATLCTNVTTHMSARV